MSNPIAELMNGGTPCIVAVFTNATCGEACWHAREDVCRCKCGGRNHGCLRGAGGVQPVRTARIDGVRYQLAAVGDGADQEAVRINKAAGPRRPRETAYPFYSYPWRETEPGAPARLRTATDSQIANWPELAAYRDGKKWTEESGAVHFLDKPDLCWARIPDGPLA